MKKYLIQLADGSFVGGAEGPTFFPSMAVLFNTESVAQVIALGIVGARVVPITPLRQSYEHQELRRNEYFRADVAEF